MRKFLIILLIVAVVGFFGYRYAKRSIDNISFSSIGFTGIDLNNILSTTGFATVDVNTTIGNKNGFSIPVNNLYVEIYYAGKVIGKSTMPSDAFTIPANGSFTVSHNVTLSLSGSLDIATKLIQKRPVEFTYMIKATLFGFYPLIYKGSFTY